MLKTGHADRKSHDIQVVEDTVVLELAMNASEPGLPSAQTNQVSNFLADYISRGRRHGPLIVSVPQNSPWAAQLEQGAADAYSLAYKSGVRDIKRSDYDSNGSSEAPMVLAYTAFRAIAPDCPSLASINLSASATNDPHPSFGCATQANLAAMIADPADLLGARRSDPKDVMRRATVLNKYRAGESSATERSEAETGAISTAVK
jgi:pilus assembly protein CpaD